jgi:flagellar L-ring protein FlgH
MLRPFPLVTALFGLFCGGVALGQTAPPPAPTARGGSSTRERPMPSAQASQTAEAQNSAMIMSQNGGSLLRASLVAAPDPARAGLKNVSVFSVPEQEAKTVKKHDLITIIIREESEVTSQGTSDLKRQSDIDAKVDSFARLNLQNFALQPSVGSVAPEVKASGTRNFKGEATVDRTDSVITRLTGEVVDVKPNGTLVIQARKKIKNDEEEQLLLCSGICRVEDVTPDNTVLSTQLFDLEFSKMNKGQVRTTTKTGFIHKLLDFVNPF